MASKAKYSRVTWDGLKDYPGETSRIYSGPLGCQHFAFIVNRQEPGSEGVMHSHDEAEEIYVLLQGEADLIVEDEVIPARPLDAIRVPPNVDHMTRNTSGADALWLVIGAPPDEFIAWDPVAYGPPASA